MSSFQFKGSLEETFVFWLAGISAGVQKVMSAWHQNRSKIMFLVWFNLFQPWTRETQKNLTRIVSKNSSLSFDSKIEAKVWVLLICFNCDPVMRQIKQKFEATVTSFLLSMRCQVNRLISITFGPILLTLWLCLNLDRWLWSKSVRCLECRSLGSSYRWPKLKALNKILTNKTSVFPSDQFDNASVCSKALGKDISRECSMLNILGSLFWV